MKTKLQSIIDVLIELGQDNYITMYYEQDNRVNLTKAISNSKLNDIVNIPLKYLPLANDNSKFVMQSPYNHIATYLGCDIDMAMFLVGNGKLNLGKYITDYENLNVFLSSEYLDVESTNHTTHDIHLISCLNGNVASFSDMVKFLKFMKIAFEKEAISPIALSGREWLKLVE